MHTVGFSRFNHAGCQLHAFRMGDFSTERERETGIPISALRNYCLDDIATSGYCETVKTMILTFVLRTPKSSKFKEFG